MWILFAAALLHLATAAAADFTPEVAALLRARCVPCHSGASAQGGLDLSTAAAALRGGKSGRAVEPGASSRSLLIEKIVSGSMPPGGPRLTAEDIRKLRLWIDAAAPQAAGVTERDALSIFQMRCVVCHGKRRQEGGLDLRTHEARLRGGKSGPALVPGNPDESLLIRRIVAGDMPPAKLQFEFSVRPPSTAEVETLRRWIAAGAPQGGDPAPDTNSAVTARDRDFWAFQPPQLRPVPLVKKRTQVLTPVDAFLLEKLEANGLGFSPAAPASVLARRAYLAVTGMPPSPEQLDAFLSDHRPDAWNRLVEKLLESPRYGERWARFWLDAVGYSDSEGKVDADELRPQAWRYRDYVIRSLNADKPYDQFLREQIAGDEMVSWRGRKEVSAAELEKLVATGFWRMAPDGTYSPPQSFLPERMNVIADQLEVFGSAILGLTVGCARCHNHKYDPLPQRDYYRLSAILQTAYDPYDWVIPTKRHLNVGLAEEWREAEQANAPIEAEIKKLEQAQRERENLPKSEADALGKRLAELKAKLKPLPHVRALYDMGGEPSGAYLLRRGDALAPGEEVTPGVPAVLAASLPPYRAIKTGESSGRRLALAEWVTHPNHPLTARVIVNRIWMHYFGRGIVSTPANFGRTGAPPSHPELLDWLAGELVRNGWRLKAIHRLILRSAAFRQSSRVTSELASKDPDNILLSRMPLRRLDADALYDSILNVTGQLDDTPFGPPSPIEVKPDGEVVPKPSARGYRRSIYLLQRRRTPLTMLETFDTPPLAPNCIERPRSVVATQALQLMNSSTTIEHARHLAGRILDEHPAARVEQAWRRTLGRAPSAAEAKQAAAALQDFEQHWKAELAGRREPSPQRWKAQWLALGDLIHTLLNSAEFSYVD